MKSISRLLSFAIFSVSIISCKQQNKPVPNDEINSSNTAIIPVSKLEEDGCDWWERHNDVLKVKDSLQPEIVLIGNSITHFWGGNYPPLKNQRNIFS